MVLDRVQRTLGGESPPGVCLEESGDELLVLLRLDAACAVNELAVRLGVCRRLAKQLELLVGEPPGSAGAEAPAQVEPATHHAGVRAGDIGQHPVVLARRRGIRLAKSGAGDAHAVAVFAQQLEPRLAVVERAELTFVFHALGDVAGLAAGRGAEVEHGLAGLRIEQGDGEQRAGVLHVEQTVAEAAE